MALDDFQMPSFKDPDGTTYIWDSASKSYVKAPLTDKRPDQSHATGGDNDLFDPFQHTEMDSVPELEGYMAHTAGGVQMDPPFPSAHEVKCPNCGDTTSREMCENCGKDLTPEWNTHGQSNEFFDVHPDFNDASDKWTWPQVVPKKNEFNYDDSFPSMSLSKTAGEGMWDDMFGGDTATEAGPALRTEVGRWILTVDGQLHAGQGDMLHEQIEQRDQIDPSTEVALGSVYNDGEADTQRVFNPDYFNLDQVQSQLQQVFGPVTLKPPLSMPGWHQQQQEKVFTPFAITSGQWFIAPNPQQPFITGSAWVKERPDGVEYQPSMILVCEHLRPEDIGLWVNGVAAIVTATGGSGSHAVYLAMTENIPVIAGIGEDYTKLQTGNYLKIDPRNETIEVIPGATTDWSSAEKQQVWNSILQQQTQKEQENPNLTPKPVTFSHVIEEEEWRLANSPTLESCPEDGAPMVEQDGEMVCHDCGHKQPIIHHQAGVAALPVAAEALEGGAAAGGAAGGGMGGIGGLMTKALRPGFGMGYAMGGGHGGDGAQAPAGDNGIGDMHNAPVPQGNDSSVGVVSRRHAAWNQRHAGALSVIWEALMNAVKGGTANAGNIATRLVNPLDPISPLSYVDDAAVGGIGAAQEGLKNQMQNAVTAAGLGDDDDDSVGLATKNDGTNSTDEASNSGIEGKKEQGDGPEQLKDVDGGHDSQGSHEDGLAIGDSLGDPAMQDKALKAFHMNLPLVIEFANSDDAGADNPILQALDAMLEEAFPGYKDGHDPAGETTEHPQEEKKDEDDTGGEPDQKSEGADKKESARIASVWHYAGLDDYAHWNEEAPRIWWEEEGRHQPEPDYGDPQEDYGTYEQADAAQEAAYEEAENDMGQMDDATLEGIVNNTIPPDQLPPNWERLEHGYLADMAREELSQRTQMQGQGMDNPYPYDAGGPDHEDMGYDARFGKTAGAPAIPQQDHKMRPPIPAGGGGLATTICPLCGQAHPEGMACPVADVTTPVTYGDQSQTPVPNSNSVVTKWHLAVPSMAPASQPQQAAGAPAAPQTCPMCGCNHMPGTPCPTYNNQAGGMQQPAAAGQPPVAGQPPAGVSYSKTAAGEPTAYDVRRGLDEPTMWGQQEPAQLPEPWSPAGANEQAEQAAGETCPFCQTPTNTAWRGTCVGCGTPLPLKHQPLFPTTVEHPAPEPLGPPRPGGILASSEHEDSHDSDSHDSEDWADESGQPLQEGAEYEMKTAASPIPDRVTIEHILPEKLTYILHSGDVDFRDTITRDQLDLDGTSFSAVDFDNTGEDSMDRFPGEEMPPRPGDDALPQEDDISSPSTALSHFEPVSLDTYTGSYEGDAPDGRSWLLEGGTGSVEVDPGLMAKMAGRDFSPREQREFIDEKGEARNLDRLDLAGTHYVDEELHTSDSLW